MQTGLIVTFTILGFLIQCLFIFVENKKQYVKAVCLKGLASLCFLSVGIIGYSTSQNKNIALLFLIGLILGVIGDILLNLRFVVKKNQNVPFLLGTVSFLAGHIFYIVSLFKLANTKLIYIPILVALVLTSIIGYFIFTRLDVKVGKKIFGVIYIVTVSLFTSVAYYNLGYQVNNFTILSSIGSLLFIGSDVILIFNSFGKHPRLSLRATNLLLYFAGQILIGTALLFL